MESIPSHRRDLWRKINSMWADGVNVKRIAVRLDLMDDELASEMADMKAIGGYELDPGVRAGIIDAADPTPKEHANVARGKFRQLGRRGHAGFAGK